jgi:SAM-dependent methyltransferase
MDGLAGSFDLDAAGYAAGRPGYPPALYELLAARCGLGPGTTVVEVGPGTGQATAELLRRGATVLAVEPGRNLAAHLRETHASPSLRVIVETFEHADLDAESADLVVSATAFHWIEPRIGLAKALELLRPGGWVGLWWTLFRDPDDADAFSSAAAPIFAAYDDAEQMHGATAALDADEWLGHLAAAGLADSVVERIPWTMEHESADLVALYATYSNVRTLPDADRRRFLEELGALADNRFGGRVTRRYETVLYTARKP